MENGNGISSDTSGSLQSNNDGGKLSKVVAEGSSELPSEENNTSGDSPKGLNNSDDKSLGRKSTSRSRSKSRSRSRSKSLSKSRSRSHSKERSRSRSHHSRRYSRGRSRSRSRHSRHGRRRHSRSRSYSRSQSHSRSPRHRRRSSSDSRSRSPPPRRSYRHGDRDNPDPSRILGVFGLDIYTSEQKIRRIFEKFGRLERVQMVYDSKTGKSRGFCFVYFDHVKDATAAKEDCSGMDVDGRRIRVDYSITHRAHTPTPGIYMGRPTWAERGYSRYGSGGRSSRRSMSPPRGSSKRSRRSYDSRSRSRSLTPHRH